MLQAYITSIAFIRLYNIYIIYTTLYITICYISFEPSTTGVSGVFQSPGFSEDVSLPGDPCPSVQAVLAQTGSTEPGTVDIAGGFDRCFRGDLRGFNGDLLEI